MDTGKIDETIEAVADAVKRNAEGGFLKDEHVNAFEKLIEAREKWEERKVYIPELMEIEG